jgi:hypothetical protein
MTREMTAEDRHKVHQALAKSGWIIMRSTLTTAPEKITSPKRMAVHGIVRHLSLPPTKLKTTSVPYTRTPKAASGKGSTRPSTLGLPLGKNGSQTLESTPNW